VPAGITDEHARDLLRLPIPRQILFCIYSPVSRRCLRCITRIEPPAHTKSKPPPTVQLRSKPVNGNVFAAAFAGCVLVVGVVLVVAGEVLAGVVVVGVFVDFEGDVPLFGAVVGAGGGVP
jgi:hypothetical protein